MQENEEISEMALEKKMKAKDSSPEEQTESLKQGHPLGCQFLRLLLQYM